MSELIEKINEYIDVMSENREKLKSSVITRHSRAVKMLDHGIVVANAIKNEAEILRITEKKPCDNCLEKIIGTGLFSSDIAN